MILNLTQHDATPEQVAAGVVDSAAIADIRRLLTVDLIPSRSEIQARANDLAWIAALSRDSGYSHAMIGGAPWMMRALEDALIDQGIEPVYAFSVRESVDQHQADGSVRKVAVFKHAGFIPAR